jgi:general secretion pathway protein L
LPLTLLLFVPDLPRFDAAAPARWTLLDAAGAPVRDGVAILADIPRAERVIAIAPPTRLLNLETPLPAVSPAKRDALLRYAIEDKLTIDPATVHAVVLGKSAGAEHVVVAIDRTWLQLVLAWLMQAALAPHSLISRAAGIAVADGEWVVLLDTPHGIARRADGFTYNFDVTSGRAPPFALTLALKEARERGHAPDRLTLFATPNLTPDAAFAATWAGALGLPVLAGKGDGENIAGYLAAARSANLLTGEFAPADNRFSAAAAMKPALALAVLLLLVQIGLTAIDNWRLNREREALEGEMTQLFKQSFPAAQAVVDAPLQMSRNLQQAKRERGLAADDDVRRAIATAARALQDVSPAPTITALGLSAGMTTIDVELAGIEQHATLRRALDKLPNTGLSNAEKNAAGKLVARVSVKAGA